MVDDLGEFAWRRVVGWLRKRHPRATWASLRRRHLPGWRPTQDGITSFNPAPVTVTRYRYRGNKIPTPLDRHVIYVIKENRTYDHVFGDLPRGNGDPALNLFKDDSAPNHRELARRFRQSRQRRRSRSQR